jgi:hypothetical protein
MRGSGAFIFTPQTNLGGIWDMRWTGEREIDRRGGILENPTERMGSLLPTHHIRCVEKTYGVIFCRALISTRRKAENRIDKTRPTHCRLDDSLSSAVNLCF